MTIAFLSGDADDPDAVSAVEVFGSIFRGNILLADVVVKLMLFKQNYQRVTKSKTQFRIILCVVVVA